MKRLALLLVVSVLAAPGLAAVENSTQATGLEFYPNFETVSVYLHFEGDANENGAATLEYRPAGGEWVTGHPLTRIYGSQWAGSIFWLKPDTAYEVRVTLSDPDGVSKGVWTGGVTTRSDRWPTGAGRTIHVAAGGAGDGSETSPFGTIQQAVDVAGPGDTVLIAPGVYRESVIVRKSGTAEAYIHIKAKEGAVLDGSDPDFLDRQAPYRWSSARRGRRGSAYDYVTDCEYPVDYVALDDEKLYGYDSLEDMLACRSGPPGGWYQDRENGKLYVHTTLAYCSPDFRKTVVSRLSKGLFLDGAEYIVVDGLEVRYFGKYGVHIDGSNNVVQNCNVHHQDVGIHIYSKKIDNTTIQDCEVRQTSVWRWPWYLTKGTRYEVDSIGARAGRGTVIRRNTISGSFDGIGLSVWEALQEPGWIQDTDVSENFIYNCGDDGCEPEGTCVNLRFWKNRIDNCLMNMSIAPVTVGPAWFIRETYSNAWLGVLKIKVSTSGVCYLYNCTFYSGGHRRSVWDYGGNWKNLNFRNCIFHGTDYVFSDTGPSKEGTVSFDYDCLHTTRPDKFLRWENRIYGSLAEFRDAGYEAHGISVEPMLTATGILDFRLRPGSPLIDAGLLIRGINDNYAGRAPDIGAHEFRP
ncbi:MAG: right-handed parallel beta-helix repeat-containing protein [Planctomycetota bacterium]|jgi:hypothetical protein